MLVKVSETGNTSCCDDRHDLLLVILTGEFGVVYKAHLMGFGNLDSMTTVAVKTIKEWSTWLLRSLCTETWQRGTACKI